jgi:hypothetical protein
MSNGKDKKIELTENQSSPAKARPEDFKVNGQSSVDNQSLPAGRILSEANTSTKSKFVGSHPIHDVNKAKAPHTKLGKG